MHRSFELAVRERQYKISRSNLMAKEKSRRKVHLKEQRTLQTKEQRKVQSNERPPVQLGSMYHDIGIKAVAAATQQKEPDIGKRKTGENPMTDIKQVTNFAERNTNATREAFEQGGVEIQQNVSAALAKSRALNVKLIEMARANAEATFDLAHDIAAAKTPWDMAETLSTHANKQIELFNRQTRELVSSAQAAIPEGWV